jgi:hypothetical protein
MAKNIPVLNTKGGMNWKANFTTTVSAADVVNHLTNEVLHLPIKTSLRTIHGPGNSAYVITVLSIAAEDLAVTASPTNFAEKVLDAYGANTKFKKDIVDKIKPFMFPTPEAMDNIMRNRAEYERLTKLGFWGANLTDIKQFSKFRHSPQTGWYVIYLDTEKIIRQMCEDPLDGELNGDFTINAVYGERDEAIRWDISISTGNGRPTYRTGAFNVTIDNILATAR